jgi:hypothetical protein
MIWIILIPSLTLPAIWFAVSLLGGWQRSKYIASLCYLFLSWLMITIAFTTFISAWENQIGVRAFLASEVGSLPLWVRVSYDFFDRFVRLISATDFVKGAIYSLPALLIPLVRLSHFRSKSVGVSAFRYAALNVAYFWFAEIVTTSHAFGSAQIIATYLRLGGYVLLLLVYWLIKPTSFWTAYLGYDPRATSGGASR